MEWLFVTLDLYRRAFTRGAALAARNWTVLGSVFVYAAIMTAGSMIAFSMGIFGGFLLSLLVAACASSFLSMVEIMIRTSRVTLNEFRNSFGTYLWDVVGVNFVFWILFRFATPAILQLPQGFLILACVNLAVVVFFNAVPELIYLGHFGIADLLRESYTFITENWIEWFPANVALAALLLAVASIPLSGVFNLVQDALLALILYFGMIVRGLLFIDLHGSTHRSRVFRYRMGGKT